MAMERYAFILFYVVEKAVFFISQQLEAGK